MANENIFIISVILKVLIIYIIQITMFHIILFSLIISIFLCIKHL